MSFSWARRVARRHHQSVTDYDLDNLRTDESMQLEIPGITEPTTPPSLPVNVAGVTGFQNLPDELLEQIFQKLSGSSRRNYFAVSGVSRSWRRLGNKLFFASPWDTPHLICHPNQLFCLSPRTPSGSRSGLLKCFVRRDTVDFSLPNGRVGHRISFFLGKDPLNTSRARFLLCAIQPSRHETLLYLNSKCEGPPCARLVSNFLCTSYTLENGMTFSLEGPNCSTTTNRIDKNNSTLASGGDDEGGNGANGSAHAAAADSAAGGVDSGIDEIEITTSRSPNNEHERAIPSLPSPCSPPPSPPSSTTVIPPLLLSLRYRARVRGLMQPRRMDAALPNPNFMACGALPKMQRGSAISSGAGAAVAANRNGVGGGAATAAVSSSTSQLERGSGNASVLLRRPSLGYISSVAALQRPPIPGEEATTKEEEIQPQEDELNKTTATTSTTAMSSATAKQVLGETIDDGGAGPSTSSNPNSAYTSLAASPESILPLSESSSPAPTTPAAVASGAIAPAPPSGPTANSGVSAQSGSGGAGQINIIPLWRRVLGFNRPQTAATAASASQNQSRLGFNFTNIFSSFSTSSPSGSGFLRARRGATFDESALPVCLVNKSPHWNEALRCWCLNFRGRVKLASVKNFQLVKDGDEDAKVSMQFGKFDKDLFILDFNPMTLSAIQAFAIALTTFDSKVTL